MVARTSRSLSWKSNNTNFKGNIMEELIKTIKQYKGIAINASAVLMFIFFGFCHVIDVMGKAQMSGLTLLFKSSGLSFYRFLTLLILLVPILIVLGKSVKLKFTDKMNENYYTLCFVVGIVLCAIFAISLKDQVTLAWGGWLYMVTAAVGIAVCNIEKFEKNKTE